MYEEAFQLKHRPFPAAPLVQHYFAGRASETARSALVRCIERAEGTGLLVGPPGSGKTLLLELLAEQFNQRFAVALLTAGRLSTRRDLLQAILFELGQPYRGMQEGDLRLALLDYLQDAGHSHDGLLLLVDEAHTLPMRLLDEVRMLTNVVRHGVPRVRLLLAGGSILEERLTHPKLESCSQRITARCYLQSLDREETRAFVKHQISLAGACGERLFSADSLEAIHDASGGVPRVINQVCDHALALAFADGLSHIDGALIEQAWGDLQQLPTPWNETSRPQPSVATGGVIEFGGDLDDLDVPAAAASLEFGEKPESAETHDAPPFNEPAPWDDELQPDELSVPDLPAADGNHDETIRLAHAAHGKRHENVLSQLSPDEQLDVIESHLAALDDVNHAPPTAAATPRKHIAGPNPFAEPFAEEVVLVDRYAQFELQFRCAVESSEGRMLSAMLEPFQHPSEASPRLTIAEESHDEVRPVDLQDSSPGYEYDLAEDYELSQHGTDSHTAACGAAAPAHEPLEQGMIIIEDDPRAVCETRPVKAARQLEYRQLFAQLRRQK